MPLAGIESAAQRGIGRARLRAGARWRLTRMGHGAPGTKGYRGKMEKLAEAVSPPRYGGGGAPLAILVDPLTGFGTRHALLLELAEAVEPESVPRLLVVFGLDGFDEYVALFGRLAGRTLLVKLAARLAESLCPGRESASVRARTSSAR